MKYVPSLPPRVTGVEDRLQVAGLAGVRQVKPVQERTLPSPTLRQHPAPDSASDAVAEIEKRQVASDGVDRRKYSRRVRHDPILIELRSGKDRRQHNQRGSDMITHIDEEV